MKFQLNFSKNYKNRVHTTELILLKICQINVNTSLFKKHFALSLDTFQTFQIPFKSKPGQRKHFLNSFKDFYVAF